MLTNMNKFNFGLSTVPSHVYCLYDEINDIEAKSITEWIIDANSMNPEEAPAVLNLFINSSTNSRYWTDRLGRFADLYVWPEGLESSNREYLYPISCILDWNWWYLS